jgi:hypothetical protein
MFVVTASLESLGREVFDLAEEPFDFGVKLVFFGELFGFAFAPVFFFFVGLRFEDSAESAEDFGSDSAANSL